MRITSIDPLCKSLVELIKLIAYRWLINMMLGLGYFSKQVVVVISNRIPMIQDVQFDLKNVASLLC